MEIWASGGLDGGYKETAVLPSEEATNQSGKTPSSAWGRPAKLCVISALNYSISQTHFHLREKTTNH